MKVLQCTHIKANGDRCGNKRNANAFVMADSFTCEAHGSIKKMDEPRAQVQDILDNNVQGIFTLGDLQTNTLNKEDPMNTDFIVAGTGSRSIQTGTTIEKQNCMNRILAALREYQSDHTDNLVVITGMAEGFDKALAIASLQLGIRTWAFVPNTGYGVYYWGKHSLTGSPQFDQFHDLLIQMEKVEYTTEYYGCNPKALYIDPTTPGTWSGQKGKGLIHANFVRNNRMVEVAREFLVWDPTSSGTSQCLAQIKRAEKPFKIISE